MFHFQQIRADLERGSRSTVRYGLVVVLVAAVVALVAVVDVVVVVVVVVVVGVGVVFATVSMLLSGCSSYLYSASFFYAQSGVFHGLCAPPRHPGMQRATWCLYDLFHPIL